MGGDLAPGAPVLGALQAARRGIAVTLVGASQAIHAELQRHADWEQLPITVVDAPDTIEMSEAPLAALRRKPHASVRVAARLAASGQASAIFSAGHTGATLLSAHGAFGVLDGVDRPALAVTVPTRTGAALLLDAGANVDCSARELVGFAHLGTVYMRDILSRPSPKVALLNIGEEEEKGTATVKEAHLLLRQDSRLNYLGNVEGRDILGGHPRHGALDVVVCDGFVGNIVLKFYESVLYLVRHLAQSGAPGLWEQKEIRAAFRMLDYSQYGGAPLLGVKGVSIICHGSSNSNAIRHAIRVAVQSVEVQLAKHIGTEFAEREAVEPA